VVFPIIDWELMRSRAVVLGEHERDADIDGLFIRYSVIDVLQCDECPDMTDVDPLTISTKMILDEIVLQRKVYRPFTLFRNPSLRSGDRRE
jgi:hypothetical protein